MGEMAEDFSPGGRCAREEEDEDLEVWTAKDGTQTKISELKDSHLLNIIKMLKRKGFISLDTLNFYLYCPEPSGDGALDAFNHELNWIIEVPVHPHLSLLEREAKKRNLT